MVLGCLGSSLRAGEGEESKQEKEEVPLTSRASGLRASVFSKPPVSNARLSSAVFGAQRGPLLAAVSCVGGVETHHLADDLGVIRHRLRALFDELPHRAGASGNSWGVRAGPESDPG